MRQWMTVLTCSARHDYFSQTMESIRHASGETFKGERIVFIDGGSAVSPEEWDWYHNMAPGWDFRFTSLEGGMIGTKPSMLYLLHEAAKADVDQIIYLEDDILLSRNSIPTLVSFTIPAHLAFVAFCDIKNVAPLDGITECPGYDFMAPEGSGGHWGNQVLKIPGHALKYLEESTEYPDWRIKIPDHQKSWPKKYEDIVLGRKASDIMLGICLALPPAPWTGFGVYSPSLAQHVGHRSLVNPKATAKGYGRDTITWPGKEFDTSTLDLTNIPLHTVVPRYTKPDKERLNDRFNRDQNSQLNRARGCKSC